MIVVYEAVYHARRGILYRARSTSNALWPVTRVCEQLYTGNNYIRARTISSDGGETADAVHAQFGPRARMARATTCRTNNGLSSRSRKNIMPCKLSLAYAEAIFNIARKKNDSTVREI